jgi:probable phosphoglycerate mutase
MPGNVLFSQPSGLLVLRHAQSTWNAAGRWQGWADPPLSKHGEAQVTVAAQALLAAGIVRFDAAYCSDLQRARQTAQGLCAPLDAPDPVARRDLREHDVGEWSGLTRPEIELGWPGQISQWSSGQLLSTPGGEARPAFEARIHAAMLDIGRTHTDQRVLVVCHGGAIRALTRVIASEQGQVGSLSGCWIICHDDRLQLVAAVDPLGAGAAGQARSLDAASE